MLVLGTTTPNTARGPTTFGMERTISSLVCCFWSLGARHRRDWIAPTARESIVRRRSTSACGAGLADHRLVLASWSAPSSASPSAPDPRDFAASVRVADVMTHLEAFDRIAAENGGNRAASTPGYEASAVYVESVLRDAGYDPVRQPFTFFLQTIESESATSPAARPCCTPTR